MTNNKEREIRSLLDEICINLGFCLPEVKKQEILSQTSISAEDFSLMVFRAEEMSPEENISLFRELKRCFIKRFGQYLNINQ